MEDTTTKQPTAENGYPQPGALPLQTVEGAVWPVTRQVPVNCPPGLEYLTQLDQVLGLRNMVGVDEDQELAWKYKKRYDIKNGAGQIIYYAKEENNCWARNCCGPLRPFLMDLKDWSGQAVLRLVRPMRCGGCCCPCCLQEMSVYSADGKKLGSVDEKWTMCVSIYDVKNAAGETILRIERPFCQCNSDILHKVVSLDGTQVGSMRKVWPGLPMERFTDADHFGIAFPMDLDVNAKATLLGALFLINFLVFEFVQ